MFQARITRSVVATGVAVAVASGCGAIELEPRWRADFDEALTIIGEIDGGLVTPKTAAAAGMAICGALDAGGEMPDIAKRWDDRGFTLDFLIEAVMAAPQICPEHAEPIDKWVLG